MDRCWFFICCIAPWLERESITGTVSFFPMGAKANASRARWLGLLQSGALFRVSYGCVFKGYPFRGVFTGQKENRGSPNLSLTLSCVFCFFFFEQDQLDLVLGFGAKSISTDTTRRTLLGLPVVSFYPLLGGRAPLLKQTTETKLVPYSNLSTGGA